MIIDDKYVQEVVKGVLGTPSFTYYDARKALFDLNRAKADAESMKSMDLSHDRVQGGTPHDMTDNVSRILDAEAKYEAAKTRYFTSILSLKHYLARARQLNLMDKTQAHLWLKYYLKGEGSISLKALADSEGLSLNRVDYLVRRKRARQAFADAVKSVLDDIDWYDPTLEDFYWSSIHDDGCSEYAPHFADNWLGYNIPIVYNYELNNPIRVN